MEKSSCGYAGGCLCSHNVYDGSGIKREGRVSVLSANIMLGIIILFFIINKYFCGFLLKNVREGYYDIFSDIGMIVLALALVTGCNYLMCTINDGEGKLKAIYCSFLYSLSPYIVFMPIIFCISHVVTYNEVFFAQLFARPFNMVFDLAGVR